MNTINFVIACNASELLAEIAKVAEFIKWKKEYLEAYSNSEECVNDSVKSALGE